MFDRRSDAAAQAPRERSRQPLSERALDRMQTGRFKVFRHLNDWFEEFRLYHRKDGRVVNEGDDLLAATRYGVMMLRYAECIHQPKRQRERRVCRPGAWMGA